MLGYLGNALLEIPMLALGVVSIVQARREDRFCEETSRQRRRVPRVSIATWDADVYDRSFGTALKSRSERV